MLPVTVPKCIHAKSHLTLQDPVDCSHQVLYWKVLKYWSEFAMTSSRVIFLTQVSNSQSLISPALQQAVLHTSTTKSSAGTFLLRNQTCLREKCGLHGRTCKAEASVLFEQTFIAFNVKPSQPHFVQHCLGAFLEKQHLRVSSFCEPCAHVQIHEWGTWCPR